MLGFRASGFQGLEFRVLGLQGFKGLGFRGLGVCGFRGLGLHASIRL